MSVYASAQIPPPPPPPDDIGAAKISCINGIKDGNETDIDCGGECGKCEPGMSCITDDDCFEGHCSENICIKYDACTDGLMDGDETDTDCGGQCNPCINGLNCKESVDCISGFCNPENVCSSEEPENESTTSRRDVKVPENESQKTTTERCPECIPETCPSRNGVLFWMILIYGLACTGAIVYLLKDKFPAFSKRQEPVIKHQLTPREETAQNYVSQYTTLGYSRNSIETGLRRNNFTQEEINKAFESLTD